MLQGIREEKCSKGEGGRVFQEGGREGAPGGEGGKVLRGWGEGESAPGAEEGIVL